MNAPDPRFRTVDADFGFLSQIDEATARFIATSGNPPPLPWLIEQWVPADETTLLAGPGSGGKSYLALQMQVSAALGAPWLGLAMPQCPSLGFYSEDRFEAVANRLHALAGHHRTSVAELMARGMRVLPKPHNTALISLEGGRRGNVTTTSEWEDLRRTMDRLSPKLLILDNLADFLPVPVFDNNSIRQARRMALDPLCAEHGATILGLQNVTLTGMRATDEAEGSSGGLAWRDAFRSRLYLRCEKAAADDPNAGRGRTLSRIKGNHAADETSGIPLKWQDGMWVPDQPASGMVEHIEQRANERWLMNAVVRVVQSGRVYSTASNQPTYLPNLLAQELDRPKRFGEKSIKTTYERLVCSDIIVIREVRDRSKGRSIDRVIAVDGHNLEAHST
jgi:RecA-family ATPase